MRARHRARHPLGAGLAGACHRVPRGPRAHRRGSVALLRRRLCGRPRLPPQCLNARAARIWPPGALSWGQGAKTMQLDPKEVEELSKTLYIRALKLLPPDIKAGFAELQRREDDATGR